MRFFMIVMAIISFNAIAMPEKTTSCFLSENNKIKLKFVEISDDGTSVGYVKYRKSTVSIPLALSSVHEDHVEEGRPVERNTTWLEVVNGKVGGKYEVMSQGARYYRFVYKGKNGVSWTFIEDPSAYDSERDECIWN